jgi:hypothetical protein
MPAYPLAVLTILAFGAPQDQPAPPEPAAAKTEKATLLASVGPYFAGRWQGSGKFVRSGKPLQSSFEFEPRLGGESMIVRHAEVAPNTFAYDGILTTDSVRGDLVLLVASNHKGGGRLFRSAGWTGDTLVFQSISELRTSFAIERISFIRLGPESFKAIYEMSPDGAAWRVGDEQVFVKS